MFKIKCLGSIFGGGKGTLTEPAGRMTNKPFGSLREGQFVGASARFRGGPPGRDDYDQRSGEFPLFINRDNLLAVPNIAEMALLATI